MVYNKENTVALNSHNEPFVLSNMYPCTLDYKDKLFCGVDHLFHYLLFYEYPDIQSQIAKCDGVCGNFKAKDISKKHKDKLTSTPRQRHNLLRKCIELKHSQCPQFKDYLDATKGKYLVEFAYWGDKEYGCTFNKDRGVYEGENVCGEILMAIRDNL